MNARHWITIAITLMAAAGCGKGEAAERARERTLAARQVRLDRALAEPDRLQPDAPVARWILPDRLGEISGLTLTEDQRLFAHGDEFGRVYEIDYRRGVIVKEFSLGPPLVPDDFEAIAVARDTMFMLTDAGVIYRFTEGEDGAGVEYSTLDTGLGALCQFEGMAFDSTTNSLVLACKNVEDGGANDHMRAYRWPLDRDSSTVDTPAPTAASVIATSTASSATSTVAMRKL